MTESERVIDTRRTETPDGKGFVITEKLSNGTIRRLPLLPAVNPKKEEIHRTDKKR